MHPPLAPRLLVVAVPPGPAPGALMVLLAVLSAAVLVEEEEEAEVGGDVIGPARAGLGVGLLVSRKMGEPGT